MSSVSLKSVLRPSSVAVAGATVLAALLIQTVLYEPGLAWKAEDGPIEDASVAVWALAAVIGWVRLVRAPSLGWLAGSVMLTWGMLRELDFQTRFTYRSIESLGFYTRPIASVGERLLAVAVLLPFAAAGLYLVYRVWVEYRAKRWMVSAWAGHLTIAVTLVVLSLAAEKILGFDSFEETCELGLAVVILFLTWDTSRDTLSG